MYKIDIHGQLEIEAYVILESDIKQAYELKEAKILVIHGHGSYILQQMVHKLAIENELVINFEYAPFNLGSTGATIIYLKKRGINV